jgi:hypothetical protein
MSQADMLLTLSLLLPFSISIRLLLPCPPALEAVLLLTTIKQSMVMASSYTYCALQPMSNMVLNSMRMKMMMMSKRIPPHLLFQTVSPVSAIPGGKNLESSCIPASNMSDDKLFDLFTGGGEHELFTNGLGLSMMSKDGNLLKSIVETDKSKSTILKGDGKWPDGLSVEFQAITSWSKLLLSLPQTNKWQQQVENTANLFLVTTKCEPAKATLYCSTRIFRGGT